MWSRVSEFKAKSTDQAAMCDYYYDLFAVSVKQNFTVCSTNMRMMVSILLIDNGHFKHWNFEKKNGNRLSQLGNYVSAHDFLSMLKIVCVITPTATGGRQIRTAPLTSTSIQYCI